jgi:membrane-bound lytic murein transglycosylase B
MSQIVRIFSLVLGCTWCVLIHADKALLSNKNAQYFINYMVKTQGFNRTELRHLLMEAKFQPQIIESMEKPYEKRPWDIYKQLFLTSQRLENGLAYWKKNQQTLEKAYKQYGVPPHIIVAILGVETLYGERQGEYRVLDALTTLAFYYPKRAPFFTKELKEFLLLCREQKVSPTSFVGSYAGAIGMPQFMPSSYRFYAVDYTGNGKRDLVHDDHDVIGSVANYFHKNGWKNNEVIAYPVEIEKVALDHFLTNTRTAPYDFKNLVAAGIKPSQVITQPTKAGVIELTTQEGEEFWVAFPNFYVITRYNTSPQYALVVHLLGLQLQNAWIAAQGEKNKVS